MSHRSPAGWTFIAVVASGIAGLLPTAIAHEVGLQFFVLLAALAGSVVAAVRIDTRQRGDLVSPLALCGVFYALAFVGGTTFFWFNPNFGQDSPVSLPFGHSALVVATALALLGWIGLATGYLIRPFAFLRIPALKLDASPVARHRALAALYVVGWVCRLIQLALGLYFHGSGPGVFVPTGGSTSLQVLSILAIFPSIAVAYAGVNALETGERKWRWLYWIGLAIDVAYYIPSGSRGQVVTIAVLALSVAYYIRGRLPLRLIAISIALLMFILFPVIHLYRDSGGKAGFAANTAGNLQHSIETYTGQTPTQTIFYGFGATFVRFSQIWVAAALVEQGRSAYPIAPGTTLVWTVTNFVPHGLWPDKPSVGTFSGDLAYTIGLTNSRDTSVSTTQFAEMYLNFGTIGVLVGMIFIGGIYRELGEWLRERKRRPIVLAIYAAFAYQILTTGETIVAGGLVGPIRAMVVLSVLMWVTMRVVAPKRRRAQPSPASLPAHAIGGVHHSM